MSKAYADGKLKVKFSDGTERVVKVGDHIVIKGKSGVEGLTARVPPDGSTRQQRRAIARGQA